MIKIGKSEHNLLPAESSDMKIFRNTTAKTSKLGIQINFPVAIMKIKLVFAKIL